MDFNEVFNDIVKVKKAEVSNALQNYQNVKVIFTEDTMDLHNAVASLDNKYVEHIECIVYENSIELYYEGKMVIEINLEEPDLLNRSDEDRNFTVSINNKHNYHVENIILKYHTETKYFYKNGKELNESSNAFYEDRYNNSEDFIEYIITLLAKIVVEIELKKIEEEVKG